MTNEVISSPRPDLRIVASNDWATELRRRQDNLCRFDELRAKVAKREKQTRTIRCTIGFLAANWFAASLVTCVVLYLIAEFVR